MGVSDKASTDFEHKHAVKWSTILICCFLSFGAMTYGAAASVISTTLGQPSFYAYMGLNDGGKYEGQANTLIGLTNSLFYAGGIFGPFMHGWLCDAYGRKWSLFVACLIVLISQVLITSAANIGVFIAFRFFAGWGSFQAISTTPMYMTEIAPPRHRGTLTAITNIGINIAYVTTGYIGLGFFFLDSPSAFRGPPALTVIPPLTICLGIYWFPESPRYLLSKGRDAEAWAVVHRLHSDPSDPSDEFAKREYYQIRKQMQLDRTLPSGYKEMFKRPSYRKRAFMGTTLLFCVMSCGILVIQNYGVPIFARLGYDNLQQLLFQTGYTANATLFSIIGMTFVDRVRRNWLIGTGFLFTGLFTALLTILLSQYEHSTDKGALGACVAMIFLYNISFELCLDGTQFVYQSEIWPSNMRAIGFAVATSVYSGINIPWLQAAPTAFATIGYYYYIIFICFSAFGSLVAFLVFPDTLHKPLEETAALFGDEDQVVVYQRQLEHAGFATLEEIEATIPGHQSSAPLDEKVRSEMVEDVATKV